MGQRSLTTVTRAISALAAPCALALLAGCGGSSSTTSQTNPTASQPAVATANQATGSTTPTTTQPAAPSKARPTGTSQATTPKPSSPKARAAAPAKTHAMKVFQEAIAKFVGCMRRNGVGLTKAHTTTAPQSGLGSELSRLDHNSPSYKTALTKCRAEIQNTLAALRAPVKSPKASPSGGQTTATTPK